MSRIEWGVVGTRQYESGIDRGVLYVNDQEGVAWPGLISVSESSDGGESVPYYLDGQKYLNVDATSWFDATIIAFSHPSEFRVCEGVATLEPGLLVTQQPKRAFNLSYRTMLGNDTDGVDHGYKLHLVYGAMTTSPGRTRKTLAATPEATPTAWEISARPALATGKKAPAHLVVDSRITPPALLAELEDILYGIVGIQARMITSDEIVAMFTA